MQGYRRFTVPVEGGALTVGAWGRRGPVVLCAHGITANHACFELLAAQLGEDVQLVVPDLRGRGRSNLIAGPWGMQAHARDLVAVLDQLGVERPALALGQSMGGFVVAVAASEFPQRFGSLLLVDGGLPVVERLPWFVPASLVVRLMIGPAMKRLSMRFASRADYHAFWRRHPALARDWSPALERYVDYDLEGEPPALRSSVRREAVIGDSRSMLADDLLPRALAALPGPVRLLRAPRGIMDGKPIYPEGRAERWAGRIRGFSVATVPDVNHYTILLAERGAAAVAAEVRALLAAGSGGSGGTRA